MVLDYVMNHVHSSSSTYSANNELVLAAGPGRGHALHLRQGLHLGRRPEGLRCWFDPFLPDFNFTTGRGAQFSVQNAI